MGSPPLPQLLRILGLSSVFLVPLLLSPALALIPQTLLFLPGHLHPLGLLCPMLLKDAGPSSCCRATMRPLASWKVRA